MTISFTEEGGLSARRGRNTQGSRTYTHTYKLKTTDPTSEGEYEVGSFAGLPVIGDPHPSDPNSVVVDIDVNNTSPPNGWTVVVSYSDKREFSGNVAQDEVLVSFSSENYEVLVQRDKDGYGLTNSAGDPFYTPPTAQATTINANVSFNAYSLSTSYLLFLDYVNETSCEVGGVAFAARTLKYGNLQVGQRQYRNGLPFYPVSYQFKFNPNTWDVSILDAGFREINLRGVAVAILDEDQQPISQPHPLNGSGYALATPINPNQYQYRTYKVYNEVDFGSVFAGVTS